LIAQHGTYPESYWSIKQSLNLLVDNAITQKITNAKLVTVCIKAVKDYVWWEWLWSLDDPKYTSFEPIKKNLHELLENLQIFISDAQEFKRFTAQEKKDIKFTAFECMCQTLLKTTCDMMIQWPDYVYKLPPCLDESIEKYISSIVLRKFDVTNPKNDESHVIKLEVTALIDPAAPKKAAGQALEFTSDKKKEDDSNPFNNKDMTVFSDDAHKKPSTSSDRDPKMPDPGPIGQKKVEPIADGGSDCIYLVNTSDESFKREVATVLGLAFKLYSVTYKSWSQENCIKLLRSLVKVPNWNRNFGGKIREFYTHFLNREFHVEYNKYYPDELWWNHFMTVTELFSAKDLKEYLKFATIYFDCNVVVRQKANNSYIKFLANFISKCTDTESA
jgi:hypothetical protein